MEKDSARDLVERLPERMRDALPQRAVDLLPESAQERLGRKRRRPRWLVIGALVGLAAGVVWLALRLKSVLAPGLDDDDDDEEPLSEPLSYPATGSGSGWPEGARAPEHTETLNSNNATSNAAGGATPTGQTGRLAADMPAAPAPPTGFERPQDLDDATLALPETLEASSPLPPDPQQALAGAVWAESQNAAPTQPSEPAQRPPVPFSESQAETNARLQLQQDTLLAAFPGMSRADIVESDGDLDRLAVILASKLGQPIDEVRGRVDTILSTGASQQQEDTGIEPDLSVRED